MSFDYEKAVWGRETASADFGHPTSIRFRNILSITISLKNGGNVLEVGCGAGQFIRGLKKQNPALNCYGSDISSEAILSAKNKSDGVNYSLQIENKLPFEDSFFDRVIILDVLEHTNYWKEILSETKRVLKSGGEAYIFVPCEDHYFSIWKYLRALNVGRNLTNKYAGHINYFNSVEILAELDDLDFVYNKKYSEHILGQLVGIFAFFMMDYKSKNTKSNDVVNNESFFNSSNQNLIIKFLKRLINTVIYFESMVFAKIPSPNLHIFAKKR